METFGVSDDILGRLEELASDYEKAGKYKDGDGKFDLHEFIKTEAESQKGNVYALLKDLNIKYLDKIRKEHREIADYTVVAGAMIFRRLQKSLGELEAVELADKTPEERAEVEKDKKENLSKQRALKNIFTGESYSASLLTGTIEKRDGESNEDYNERVGNDLNSYLEYKKEFGIWADDSDLQAYSKVFLEPKNKNFVYLGLNIQDRKIYNPKLKGKDLIANIARANSGHFDKNNRLGPDKVYSMTYRARSVVGVDKDADGQTSQAYGPPEHSAKVYIETDKQGVVKNIVVVDPLGDENEFNTYAPDVNRFAESLAEGFGLDASKIVYRKHCFQADGCSCGHLGIDMDKEVALNPKKKPSAIIEAENKKFDASKDIPLARCFYYTETDKKRFGKVIGSKKTEINSNGYMLFPDGQTQREFCDKTSLLTNKIHSMTEDRRKKLFEFLDLVNKKAKSIEKKLKEENPNKKDDELKESVDKELNEFIEKYLFEQDTYRDCLHRAEAEQKLTSSSLAYARKLAEQGKYYEKYNDTIKMINEAHSTGDIEEEMKKKDIKPFIHISKKKVEDRTVINARPIGNVDFKTEDEERKLVLPMGYAGGMYFYCHVYVDKNGKIKKENGIQITGKKEDGEEVVYTPDSDKKLTKKEKKTEKSIKKALSKYDLYYDGKMIFGKKETQEKKKGKKEYETKSILESLRTGEKRRRETEEKKVDIKKLKVSDEGGKNPSELPDKEDEVLLHL